MTTLEDLSKGEMRFLLRRVFAEKTHERPRCYGYSSDALAFHAVGLRDEPDKGHYPADEHDLDACERTYEMAPAHLKLKMLPVLLEYRSWVAARMATRGNYQPIKEPQ